MNFRKVFLVFMNVLLFILGVVVIAIGSDVIRRGNKYGELLLEGVLTPPIVILISGIFITILGFLGFAGALRESKCMLYTYGVIVFALFLVIVASAVIVLMIDPEASKNALESFMDKQLQKYDGSDEALTKKIDEMQKNMQCCGVNGTAYWTSIGMNIPDSCICQKEDSITDEICQKSGRNYYYQQGCVEAIIEDLQIIFICLGVAAIFLALLMFCSMTAACGLANRSNYNESLIK